MRNIFDQYSQPENRLTHALFGSLAQSPELLEDFLRNVCNVPSRVAVHSARVSVQHYPRGREYDAQEIDDRNIPDAWIYSDDGWAIVFEAKIASVITELQLTGHRRTAGRFGFDRSHYFSIVATHKRHNQVGWTELVWPDIYLWLRGMQYRRGGATSAWAKIAADYFEILEGKMLENGQLNDLALTAFSGLFADASDYNYIAAKNMARQLRRLLCLDERLQQDLAIDPSSKGRGSITGKDSDAVWDFVSLRAARAGTSHTGCPHLTIGIGRRQADAFVTFPNAMEGRYRRALFSAGMQSFQEGCFEVLRNLDTVLQVEPQAVPTMRCVQRRYPYQRATPYIDAELRFDLRTAFSDLAGPKFQPEWLKALFDSEKNSNSNLQFQIGMVFEYDKCPSIATPRAEALMRDTFIGCRPLIAKAIGEEQLVP